MWLSLATFTDIFHVCNEHGWLYQANPLLNIVSSAVGGPLGILCDTASLCCPMWSATFTGLQAQLSLWGGLWPQSWWMKISDRPKPGITTQRFFSSSPVTTHSDYFHSCQLAVMRGWLGRKDTGACHPCWTKDTHSHIKVGNLWLNLSPH